MNAGMVFAGKFFELVSACFLSPSHKTKDKDGKNYRKDYTYCN